MSDIILITFSPVSFALLKVTSQEPRLGVNSLTGVPVLSIGGLGFPHGRSSFEGSTSTTSPLPKWEFPSSPTPVGI